MLRSALLEKISSGKKKTSVKTPKATPKKSAFVFPNGDELADKKAAKTLVKAPKSRRKSISDFSINEFDEEIREMGEKFRINPNQVKQGLQGLIKFTLENPKLKNRLFEDEQFPIFLQISSIKIAKGHSRIVRIPLKHSTLTPDSEVCMIVPDVKGIANKKHEEHLEHYEKLLRAKGVDNVKKIMTFHEFRTEYETFELRNKLVELYDAFLVDGRISGKTVAKCGKIFYKKRKIPTAIKLRATKLKEHIEQTLRKTPLYLHSKGDSFIVQIGHSKMGLEELVENAFYVFKGLEKEFPGGFGNVRTVNLFAYRGLAIPIYTTFKNQNEVNLSLNEREPKPVETFSGELTTRINSGVAVTSTGEVSVYQLNNNNNNKNKRNAEKVDRNNKRKAEGDSNKENKKKKKIVQTKGRKLEKKKKLNGKVSKVMKLTKKK